MQFRSALIAHDPVEALANSEANGLTCLDPSLASQEMTDDSNINRIVETWVRTGMAVQNPAESLTGDFSSVDDYRTMLDKLNRANAEFQAFPANVRSFFQNNPANLIAALDNPSMTSQLQEFGIKAKPASTPSNSEGSPQ